ncbi:hypothetical protein TRFO_29820 [Tritrichomonas foetus]|uniref:DUF3447 domain-containing protein n=1 Tax=Tritrichomonas foetus TaxID=1144522 RepID=A0A1J4JWW1_9EUKA|nr:hypothetical protein TRFO_29820 [Tritrichomonas foetus]|eukprot:OHT02944.1 hypothetical protein TRFO_29820 [Tritrichomonas foetus]
MVNNGITLENIEELIHLQNLLVEPSDTQISDVISFVQESPDFLQNKEMMTILLQSLFSAMKWRRLNIDTYIEIISILKENIKELFSSDELCISIFRNDFVRLKLLEIGLITLDTILKICKESDESFLFFLPEVRVRAKRLFRLRLRLSYPLKQQVIKFDLESHKKLRKYSFFNDNLHSIIRSDDIDGFQFICSNYLIDISLKRIDPSIYEIEKFINKSKPSLIELASFYGSFNIFKFLWMNKVDFTPNLVKFAIAGGNIEIIKTIENEKVHFMTENFISTLKFAIRFHRNEIANYLIENYQDNFISTINNNNNVNNNNHIDNNNNDFLIANDEINHYLSDVYIFYKVSEILITNLLTSIKYGNFEWFHESINEIIEKKININLKNKVQQNVLHFTVEHSRYAMLKILCERFKGIIEINAYDNWKETPLMRAAELGEAQMVKYLVSLDEIDINSKDDFGWTPLTLAASKGYLDCVKYLCENENIDINSQKNDNETALHTAVSSRSLDVVDYLCSREGIKINLPNKDGRTPLTLAIMNNFREIEEYLAPLVNSI